MDQRSDRPELKATSKAIGKARANSEGFASISGPGVVPMRIGLASVEPVLGLLEALLAEADRRQWRLDAGETGVQLCVGGEGVAFRIEEAPDKTPHKPTAQELAMKASRDRWGGDSQPWPTWDLAPSGRLAFIIEENSYSGLRRTYTRRKGYAFEDSLEAIISGVAGHAALKAERRREDEARAKAAAIAEARRARLEAFQRREARRAEFIEAIGLVLDERLRLTGVRAHLESGLAGDDRQIGQMAQWVSRRLAALEAQLKPENLAVSARAAKVTFLEPPPEGDAERYWYAPEVQLRIREDDPQAEGMLRAVAELDWAVGAGLIADPRAESTVEPNPPSEATD